jgi:hypothetical protein
VTTLAPLAPLATLAALATLATLTTLATLAAIATADADLDVRHANRLSTLKRKRQKTA